MSSFNFATTPFLHFGKGKVAILPTEIKVFGTKVLLITGARSFISSVRGQEVLGLLNAGGFSLEHYTIEHEPTPALVDNAVQQYHGFKPDVVVGIGGGSVLDAGKAISAMLSLNEPVKDYLEGVGTKAAHPGKTIPFIAVPTTAGTGSEATKNAVLSETGEKGYKKSLRHNNFVPDVAIIDPLLALTCPPGTTAASGMDAFTQLLESYVSTAANALTDAWALEGLRQISQSLKRAYEDGSNIEARTGMALAAYLSGVTLANAGLGLVHGFASSIGGYHDIPHGIICSTLMAPANRVTIRKLRAEKSNDTALRKYSTAGKLFTGNQNKSDDYYIDHLLEVITAWTTEMDIPTLGRYGITSSAFEKIVNATDNKNNPVNLGRDEMTEVLTMAISG
jgi:alcohol dehydrogenase class IV